MIGQMEAAIQHVRAQREVINAQSMNAGAYVGMPLLLLMRYVMTAIAQTTRVAQVIAQITFPNLLVQ